MTTEAAYKHRGDPGPEKEDDLAAQVKELVHNELGHFLRDVEFRLGQIREVESRINQAAVASGEEGVIPTKIYVEDMVLGRHNITGYTVTANSPSAGNIAWNSVHVVYNGVDYTCADGSTAMKYVWFVKPGSGTAATLNTGNTKPTLGAGDALIFVNNGGVPISVLESSLPPALGNGAVDNSAIASGAVTPDKTSFYSALADAVTAAQTAADLAQATADGAINTYFQSNPPWATGSTQDPGKVGDIWYDADTGQGYRWSGAGGTPANTWILIQDTQITAALAAAQDAQTTANAKITTFYSPVGSVPTATAIGDLWVVTDQGNQLRRATATGTGSWTPVQISGAAIANKGIGTTQLADSAVTSGQLAANAVIAGKVASGAINNTNQIGSGVVTDTNIGSGISGSKLAAGTVGNTQIGTGIAGTKLADGTVGATQLGSGAITPVKLNILQHVLY